MAKKSNRRSKASNNQSRRQQGARASQPRRRQKIILGGVIVALAIGIGVFVRYWQQSRIPPQLQGAIGNHYTRGAAGAAVVIKEFSDFT